MSDNPTTPDMLADAAVRTIAPELLLQLVRSGVAPVIVDVRERELVADGTVEGARCFPLRHLGARLDELGCFCSRPIVLVSKTGSRARTAAAILSLAGFTDASALDGGLDRWVALGYPITVPCSVRPSFIPAPAPAGRDAAGNR